MSVAQRLLAQAHYQRLEEKRLAHLFATRFKGKSLLDIGCGQGKYLRLLARDCSCMTGVDANPDQVAALRQEGFDVFTPEELPAGKYDLLLMSHIVEHMTAGDLVQFMDRYLPMLNEGGKLILITPLPGIRFWHDYTHVRPYTPQSIGMMFGILGGPVAFRPKIKMSLEDIWFFRDSWRIRNHRLYYPSSDRSGLGARGMQRLISLFNIACAGLHIFSGGRLGVLSSWAGIYQHNQHASASSQPSSSSK